jgi:hypothetical protein
MKNIVIFSLFLSFNLMAKIKESDSKSVVECTVTKEFITTLEFLRQSSSFQMDEKIARDLAMKVSSGCDGASKRFIMVANLLAKAGMDVRNGLEVALKLSSKDDATTNNFIHLFKLVYTPNFLDLTVGEAVDTGLALSEQFNADQKMASQDFEKIVRFCLAEKELNLPGRKCAKLGIQVTKHGERFHKPIAPAFIKLYQFIQSKKVASLGLNDILSIVEKVITNGPVGVENFIQAYNYAQLEKGLALDQGKSIEFAIQLSNKTVR